MWYLLVQHISAHTDWEPKWALRQKGNGPLLRIEGPYPLVFDTVRDAVYYVKGFDPLAYVEARAGW